MPAGLEVIKDSGSVLITSEYPVLVFSERQLFQITSRYSDGEGGAQVTFLKPIKTPAPPQVFFRYISGRQNGLAVFITLRGSAGNWTGFNVTSAVAGGNQTQNFAMECVVARFGSDVSQSGDGIEIYADDGTVSFSSKDSVVRYGKFTKKWRWQQFRVPRNLNRFHSDLPIDDDDFISVTSMDFGVSWFMDGADYAGLTLLEGGKRILSMTVNVQVDQNQYGGYWYQGTNNTLFSIPVCKFPIDRYHN